MTNSKLIALIFSLSPLEFKEFGRYLKTPFFNRDKKVIALYNFIRKQESNIKSDRHRVKKFEKELVFKKVFSNETYTPRKMRDIMSDLTLHLEDYIVWKLTKEKSYERQQHLINYTKEKNLEKFLFQYSNEELKKIDAEPIISAENHYKKFTLLKDLFYHSSNLKLKTSNKDSLLEIMEQLDISYLISKLYYAGTIYNRKFLMNETFDSIFLLESITKEIHNLSLKGQEKIELYFKNFILLKTNEIKYYYEVKSILFRKANEISRKEQQTILSLLYNLSYIRRKELKTDYKEEGFTLLKFGIENGVFEENGILPQQYYTITVYAACQAKNYAWVKTFIDQYTDKLQSKFKESARGIALAYLYFGLKQFEDVIGVLTTISFEDLSYKVRTKCFIIRSYYELFIKGKDYPIYNACEAFRIFLRRENSYSDSLKKEYNLFIIYVKRLSKTYEEKGNGMDILEALQKEGNLSFKDWLIEKAEELSI